MTFIRTSAGASARGMSSISIVTVIVTITILSVCPIDLMVANIEDATPYSALSTHDITALVLGDEKSENPRPVITRAMIITKICVSPSYEDKYKCSCCTECHSHRRHFERRDPI